jgi:exopolysaccharide biosynthesis polyprenyl glycosylphosphotransferase
MNSSIATAEGTLFPVVPLAKGRRSATPVMLAGLLGDLIAVFFALTLSSWLRFGTPLARLGIDASAIDWRNYYGHAAIGTLIFILLLPHRQMCDLNRILHFRQTLPIIIRTASTWLLTCMALAWLLRNDREISRIYVFIAFFVMTTVFSLWRLAFCRIVACDSIARRLRQRILFVGWSEPAFAMAQAIVADNRHPYEIAGYVPLRTGREPGGPAVFIRRLGDSSDIPDVLQEHQIDTVILAEENPSSTETVALANLCEKELVSFKIIPNCFQVLLSCLRMQTVDGVPIMGISHLPIDSPVNAMIKQLVDLAGGCIGLLLSAPIITLFGLLVYYESPGPIIYRQRRLGRHGRPFWIFKIRSMKLNAEADGKVGWTKQNDPRRLRVGSFMRRWNIDELPQFWNVLRGEMSLVGPRPERPELIQIFKEEIPHYNTRHNIKPGITGWAQVNGFRGDTDLRERIRCDLHYIENWSPLLDLQIMLMTLFHQKNAC